MGTGAAVGHPSAYRTDPTCGQPGTEHATHWAGSLARLSNHVHSCIMSSAMWVSNNTSCKEVWALGWLWVTPQHTASILPVASQVQNMQPIGLAAEQGSQITSIDAIHVHAPGSLITAAGKRFGHWGGCGSPLSIPHRSYLWPARYRTCNPLGWQLSKGL